MPTNAEIRQQIRDLLFAIPEGSEPGDIRNTSFFKILVANPSFARIWREPLRRCGANPSVIKDLEIQSGIFSDPDQSPDSTPAESPKGSLMAVQSKTRICAHIKVNGVRCGSPALRSEIFCYFHQRMFRGVSTPPRSRLHPIALLEDGDSIQAALMEIINALVRNHIDLKRAQLILRALHIAVRNARNTRFPFQRSSMVSDVPDYPGPPEHETPPEPMLEQAAVLGKWKRRKASDWGLTGEDARLFDESLRNERSSPPI